MVKQLDDFIPLFVAGCFYIIVFILGQVSRHLVRKYLDPGSSLQRFLIEAITTAQMCTCVYENAVIIRNYGPWGFFFVVSTILIAGANVNRGGYVSPLAPIELFFKGAISSQGLVEIILGQAVGGYLAFRIARNLWYSTSVLTLEHSINYENTKCAFVYKVPFTVAFAFEFVGCFLLRLLLARIPPRFKTYFGPVITASFLAFSLAFIGVVGLNPTVAASRMYGCDGLNTLWFIVTYWVCPLLGWMTGAAFDSVALTNAIRSSEKRD
ncbi:unnamed protein product [Enterobius vermicularis]|uniref:Aquaporin n=1 Tax=Enterobius vermicularis TaxID=51028 RepID=A0A0N4V109_ENTVE|nr:unnamed protein product [Enterobius vermicularis]